MARSSQSRRLQPASIGITKRISGNGILPVILGYGGSRTRSGWRRLANDCKASVGS
jgi:hypothetical protein